MEPNNIELLEAFAGGRLSPEEHSQVENRLRTDDEFRQEYELYQLMVAAIAENRRAELKTYISKHVRIKPVQFFKTPTFYAAAAASVVLCMLSYFVIYKKLNEGNTLASKDTEKTKIENTETNNPDSAKPVTQTADPKATAPENPTVTNSGKATPEKKDIAFQPNNNTKNNVESTSSNDGVNAVLSKAEDIKVESDKMVADSFLFISRKIYIAKPKQYQTSPSDVYTVITTGDKRKLEVQFWRSPVNYSGYRFAKDLLVIYGDYDPAQASFQELKDLVYMKYKNEYYKIIPNENYSGLKKETDSKIISELELTDKK